MFYKFFVTTFLVLLIHVFIKAKPEFKDNNANIYKVSFCLAFMLVQSVVVAGIVMVIYNVWK